MLTGAWFACLTGGQTKEAHKIFDEVFINVKSGDGGQGEIVAAGTGRMVRNLKYKPGGNMSKQIWLPASEWATSILYGH